MNNYDTLSEAIQSLKEEGYTEDFNLKHEFLYCKGAGCDIHPDDFIVDKYYRFEGNTDPADEAILYAISSEKYSLKGVLVNGYGIYAEDMTQEMAMRLQIH